MTENDTMNAVRQHTFGGPEALSVERVVRPALLPTEGSPSTWAPDSLPLVRQGRTVDEDRLTPGS